MLPMSDEMIAATVCTAMMRLGTRMAALFDQRLAAFEITQAQFRVLLALWKEDEGEGITPSALAKSLLIERATISVLTQRMLERDLLMRSPGENRRSFRLRMTAKGEALLWTVIPHACALADETLAANTSEDIRSALAFLEGLEARLREMMGADGGTPTATREEI